MLWLLAASALAYGAPAKAAFEESFDGVFAQETPSDCTGDNCEKTGGDEAKTDAEKPKPKIKALSEFVKEKSRIDGLFPFYRDSESGVIYMEIDPKQLGPEYIYHNFVQSGVSGLLGQLADLRTAGQIQENYVIRLRRNFNQVEILRRSTAYVVDKGSPLERAAAINNGDSLMATLNIVAQDEKSGRIVVAATPLFKGTDLLRLGSNASPLLTLLGAPPTLNKAKTAIRDVANFPNNSSVLVEYVFDFKKGPQPVGILLQHNITPLPADGFTPRADDPRVGFFTVQQTHLGKMEGLPYEDKIRRWRLEKTDVTAASSPVKKPITFWIQNSTPLEYRDTIRAAALKWNEAFAQAGFENAIDVKIQPDDAKWSAGDVRYNVIQWIASPSPSFNGYGPSVVNPLTGEILAANIVLEQNSVSRQLLLDKLAMPSADAADPAAIDSHESFEQQLHLSLNMAEAMLSSGLVAKDGDRAVELKKLVQDSLYYLVMHEVGHTLGLTHNMKGSYYRSVEQLVKGLPADETITGSVMDYPATNILPGRDPDLPYYPTRLGPYDVWAIGFGYDDRMGDAAFRARHLERAGSPGYLYGNDAEDMRATGRGMDPRVIPYDMSSDPIGFATAQMDLIRGILSDLPADFARQGLTNSDLLKAHVLLLSLYRQQALTVSRYVGGVYTDRDLAPLGADGAMPMKPVSRAEQERAMAVLQRYVLGPDALTFDPAYLANLVAQRRGMSGIDLPDVVNEIWRVQSPVIDHLLYPVTLARLSASVQLGGQFGVAAMLDRLDDMVFAADIGGSANAFRRNLQSKFVDKLIGAYGSSAAAADMARPDLYASLRQIERQMRRAAAKGDPETRAHRQYLVQKIEIALKDKG
jgi:hypothetical protein